jgi:hypothetical protein
MGEQMFKLTLSRPRHSVKASGQLYAPAALPPGAHWIGHWVGPRTGLDDVGKILDPTGTQAPTPLSSSPKRYSDCAILGILNLCTKQMSFLNNKGINKAGRGGGDSIYISQFSTEQTYRSDDFYKYYVSGHYPSSYLYLKTPSCLFFKTQSFGDWILSPS